MLFQVTGQRRWLQIALIYLLFLGGGWLFGDWLLQYLKMEIRPVSEPLMDMMVMSVAAVYVMTSALPFVPGAEIGLGLILAFGARIVLLVYLCTVSALVIAYLVGHFVPVSVLVRIFGYFGMERTARLATQFEKLDIDQRLALLVSHSPKRFIPALIRHRYLALIVLINTPGNSLIGGGGGIAFTAGLSGLFSFCRFALTTAIAVAPVPLFVYLMA